MTIAMMAILDAMYGSRSPRLPSEEMEPDAIAEPEAQAEEEPAGDEPDRSAP